MDNLLKKKSILTVAGSLLIAAIWFNLLYLPGTHKIKAVQSNRQRLEQEITSSKSLVAGVGQIMQRVDLAQSRVQEKLNHIYYADSIPDFIQSLTALMKGYNLDRVQITPELPDLLDDNQTIAIGSDILSVIEFRFDGRGRYLQLGKFLEYLQNQPYFEGVSSLSLNYNQSTNPEINFDLKISTYLKRQG